MFAWTECKRVRGGLIVSFVLVAAACGSSTETVAAEAAPTIADVEATPTTSAAPTTTSTTTVPATSTSTSIPVGSILLEDETTDHQAHAIQGLTYRTTMDVPVEFELPVTDGYWRVVHTDQWSTTLVFGSDNISSDNDDAEPGFIIAVAPEGATTDSVVQSMIDSKKTTINYTRSDGLFEGREAVILEGTYDDSEFGHPVPVMMSEDSFFSVLFKDERTYRSQIFEQDGRVFIISIDGHPDDIPLLLAEIAPILESMEIGVDA